LVAKETFLVSLMYFQYFGKSSFLVVRGLVMVW